MPTRGIRGAIHVEADTKDAIIEATHTLLNAVLDLNPKMVSQEIAAAFFTLTPDLSSTFPALAARQLGWVEVPLLCYQELDVPGSLPKILRVLILWNTDLPQREIRHAYLGEAAALRPDLERTARQQLAHFRSI